LGFKLSDGTLLTPIPMHNSCGTGHDPLANFTLTAGQEVIIGYETASGSPCRTTSAARVTCITLAEPGEK
jgi:hypothetical protein